MVRGSGDAMCSGCFLRTGQFLNLNCHPSTQPCRKDTLELVLTTGERLRIGAGVDARTLQQVLEALRT